MCSLFRAFPILDQQSFLQDFHHTFDSISPSKNPTWCALVNVVLAIGGRASKADDELVCGLFGNALSLFSRVALGMSDLRKVQTLTLMVMYLSNFNYTF